MSRPLFFLFIAFLVATRVLAALRIPRYIDDITIRVKLRCEICSLVGEEVVFLHQFYKDIPPSLGKEDMDPPENHFASALRGICEEVSIDYALEPTHPTPQHT